MKLQDEFSVEHPIGVHIILYIRRLFIFLTFALINFLLIEFVLPIKVFPVFSLAVYIALIIGCLATIIFHQSTLNYETSDDIFDSKLINIHNYDENIATSNDNENSLPSEYIKDDDLGQAVSTKKIRIIVVEDENVVREGLIAILRLQTDIDVVGEALDGIQAVQLASKVKPDVILLDLAMPREDGLTTIPKLKEILPESKILVLTSFAERDKVYQAIKSGALGFLLKDATRVQLLQAIRDVAKGQASIQPSIAMKVIQEIDHPAHTLYTVDPLTPRELETLRLIVRSLSNSEISAELHVHERTVAKYVSSILEKLQLANRAQAALYAIREGLTEPRDKK